MRNCRRLAMLMWMLCFLALDGYPKLFVNWQLHTIWLFWSIQTYIPVGFTIKINYYTLGLTFWWLPEIYITWSKTLLYKIEASMHHTETYNRFISMIRFGLICMLQLEDSAVAFVGDDYKSGTTLYENDEQIQELISLWWIKFQHTQLWVCTYLVI